MHIRVFGNWTKKLRTICEERLREDTDADQQLNGFENKAFQNNKDTQQDNVTVIELDDMNNNGDKNGQQFDHLKRKMPTLSSKGKALFKVCLIIIPFIFQNI